MVKIVKMGKISVTTPGSLLVQPKPQQDKYKELFKIITEQAKITRINN